MPERTKPPPDESVTYSSGPHDGPPDLRILHYNDVYHVDSSSAEPVGGVARFMTLIKHYREDEKFQGQPDPVTLFSGDAFNPSLESSVTKGMLLLRTPSMICSICVHTGVSPREVLVGEE